MFGDLLGNMKEKQEAMRKELADLVVEATSGEGLVKVSANANREIVNIAIDKSLMNPEDIEQLEDLLIATINKALENAAAKEAEAAQQLFSGMLPPGLGNLSDLMG